MIKQLTTAILMQLVINTHAAADTARINQILNFARGQAAAMKEQILAQPELRQELGLKADAKADFQFDLAFQERYLKDGILAGTAEMDGLVMEGDQVVIPFCSGKHCILATFGEDGDSGELGLLGYGGSLRASRIAESFGRLEKLQPGYKGDAQIVEYPAGMMSFLVIDGQDADGSATKVFLHATEAQAARFKGEDGSINQTVSMADLADLVAKVDDQARKNAVHYGLVKKDKTETGAFMDGDEQDGSGLREALTEAVRNEQLASMPLADAIDAERATSKAVDAIEAGEAVATAAVAQVAAPVKASNNYAYVVAALLMVLVGFGMLRRVRAAG